VDLPLDVRLVNATTVPPMVPAVSTPTTELAALASLRTSMAQFVTAPACHLVSLCPQTLQARLATMALQVLVLASHATLQEGFMDPLATHALASAVHLDVTMVSRVMECALIALLINMAPIATLPVL